MYNPNDEVPISPLKKLKILSEQHTNVPKVQITSPLKPVIEETRKETAKLEAVISDEPLLQETSNQYVIFPINHDDMWSMYKELVNNFWSVTENIQQLDSLALNYNEKQYMKYFSSIFASPDSRGLVNENFAEELCKIIQVTEAKFFYGHQLFVQNIHFEMYNKLIDNFAATNEEKIKLFKIVEEYDSVAKKRNWIAQWTNASLGEQLMASACMHGLMFTSLEMTRDWLKFRTRNSFNHEIIDFLERMIYDQELQRDFACLMISHMKHRPNKDKMLESINQAAKIEFDFLINGLKSELIEVKSEDIIQLIDKNTKALKLKLFNSFDEKKKKIASESENKAVESQMNSSKENHQKLVFDDDF